MPLWENGMWKVQYKSVLTGAWVDSHLGNYSTERRASNAARAEFEGRYEWRVEKA
jgi:hypothetical protein